VTAVWKPIRSDDIGPAIAKTGRRCGECSLCCRLLDVKELKPTGQWCPHCQPGQGGCTIYQNRPRVCRDYACAWLINSDLDDSWYPAHSRIIVDSTLFPTVSETETVVMRFHVCPHSPDRWREEPYYSTIKSISLLGLRGHEGANWFTIVTVGSYLPGILVLPHREVVWGPGVMMALGPDRFEYVRNQYQDVEAALQLNDLLANVQSLIIQAREANPKLTTMECFDLVAQKLTEKSREQSLDQSSGLVLAPANRS
jgi:hypothetical protein